MGCSSKAPPPLSPLDLHLAAGIEPTAKRTHSPPPQVGPNMEKLLYAATCAVFSPDRHFYDCSGGNFAENGLWHSLKEATVSDVLLKGISPNLS